MNTQAALEDYRARLLSLTQQVSGESSRLEDETFHGLGGESGGGLSNVPLHLADLGNATTEEETGLTLLEQQERLLMECNAALARIDAGTFGSCEECGRPIAPGRLEAIPYARWCVACARRMEGALTR